MADDIAADIRLDPRIRNILALVPSVTPGDVASREELIAESSSPDAVTGRELFGAVHDTCDAAAPSAGLEVTTERFESEPDGNSVNLQIIRPESDEPLPCVY